MPCETLVSLLADAGVPMIALTWPIMLILLIPIIVTEGLLCKKWLGLSTWQAMKANTLSNLLSTVIGVPLAWGAMLGFEVLSLGFLGSPIQKLPSPIADAISVLLGSAWVGPVGTNDSWVIPVAALVLLVPFFFVSYGVEYLVLYHMVGVPEGGPPNVAYPRVRVAVRNANLVTYGAMVIAVTVWLMISLPHH